MIPQLIYIALIIVGLTIHLVKHGEKRTDSYNVFIHAFGIGLTLWILHSGGFFDVMLQNF